MLVREITTLYENEFTVVQQGVGNNRSFNVLNPQGQVVGNFKVPGAARAEVERLNRTISTSTPTATTTDPADGSKTPDTEKKVRVVTRPEQAFNKNSTSWEVEFEDGSKETRRGSWQKFDDDYYKQDKEFLRGSKQDLQQQYTRNVERLSRNKIANVVRLNKVAGVLGLIYVIVTCVQKANRLSASGELLAPGNDDNYWTEIVGIAIEELAELILSLYIGHQVGVYAVGRVTALRAKFTRHTVRTIAAQTAKADNPKKRGIWKRISGVPGVFTWLLNYLLGYAAGALLIDWAAKNTDGYLKNLTVFTIDTMFGTPTNETWTSAL